MKLKLSVQVKKQRTGPVTNLYCMHFACSVIKIVMLMMDGTITLNSENVLGAMRPNPAVGGATTPTGHLDTAYFVSGWKVINERFAR